MGKKRTVALMTIPVAEVPKRMEDFKFDAPKVDLGPKFGRIRDGQLFLSVGLTRFMEEKWGAFTAVHTSTDTTTSKVTVFKADPLVGEPVPVNRHGTMNSAVFSFFVPLQMLNLHPGKDRQFEVVPFVQPIQNAPVAFVFDMEKRLSLPRNRQEEEAEEESTTDTAEAAPAGAEEKAQ
jgi:hypothetical protein